MKSLLLIVIFMSMALGLHVEAQSCGAVFNDTFNEAGALPSSWVEYNTSGRVTVENGHMKFNHNTTKPSVYRTFDPVSKNTSFSFDVQGSRSSANCQVDLVSSDGKFLASIAIGKGTADIKYATSIGVYAAGVIGTNKFTTNTNYSLSVNVDFTSQTVDFYHAGVLTLENIPFLEAASDISKIDIQLLYMYSNNGTFFFDNVSLVDPNEARQALNTELKNSQELISGAVVGPRFQQYPQESVNTFQGVIDEINAVLSNCDALDETITAALTDLQSAKALFLSTQINPIALTLYSISNFAGEEKGMYCGYYNGTLEDYNDKAVSFKLKKGYMATFAQDVNGTGVSKVYIASEADLAINLPTELQGTVSFIRVGPWRDVHKKGIGAKGDDVVAALNNEWYYNWGITGKTNEDVEFVPNQWGGGTVAKAISLGKTLDITHYMAFNEPDNDDQSNMTTDKAIEKYEALLASGLRLGSPACTDGAKGANWRDEFMTKAEAKGLRIDFMVVHYYKKSTAANFYNWMKAVYDKWQRPIWVKEFNYGATWLSNAPTTNAAASAGLESYLNKMDGADFIERYAVFTWQPDKPVYSLMSVRNPITLSISGNMYHDHVSPIAYQQETYEQGPSAINDNVINSKVFVYPTIVETGVLNVDISGENLANNMQLSIYNLNGQIMKQVLIGNSPIDVSSLAKGMYVVHINNANQNYVEKIIVK